MRARFGLSDIHSINTCAPQISMGAYIEGPALASVGYGKQRALRFAYGP